MNWRTSLSGEVLAWVSSTGRLNAADGRLVRLERHQGEYWMLSLMLAGFKTLHTRCVERSHSPYKFGPGFFAEELQNTLECLPEHLWKTQRRKRTYITGVLARAEAQSAYQPARRLRVRTKNGHYLPNPLMQLRTQTLDGPDWRSVYEALNLPWVNAGTDRQVSWAPSLTELIESAAQRMGSAVWVAPGSQDRMTV